VIVFLVEICVPERPNDSHKDIAGRQATLSFRRVGEQAFVVLVANVVDIVEQKPSYPDIL
jgi:hypothetical protein